MNTNEMEDNPARHSKAYLKKCIIILPKDDKKNYFKDLEIKINKKKNVKDDKTDEEEEKCCAPLVNCLLCRTKRVNKVHPGVEGKKAKVARHTHDDDDDVKLIIRLVGSVPDSSRQKIYFNNVRYFLLLLMELVIKKQCWLLIPEGNNKSLETFLWKMNETAAEHKELMFAKDPGEKSLNDFIEDKKRHRTKECIIMCNGSQARIWEIEKYTGFEKPVLILKESGDTADIISTLQKQWLESDTIDEKEITKLKKSIELAKFDENDEVKLKKNLRTGERDKNVAGKVKKNIHAEKTKTSETEQLKQLKEILATEITDQIVDKIKSQTKYTILDIGIKLTEHVIINHILQCIVDEPEKINDEGIEKFEKINVNFLLLCVKLNQLDIADNIGGLWKIAFQDEDNRSESEKTTDSKTESNTEEKNILCYALRLERYHFIRHLMQHGLHLENFLTIHDIHNPNLKNDDRDIEEVEARKKLEENVKEIHNMKNCCSKRIQRWLFHYKVLYNKKKICLKYYEQRFAKKWKDKDLKPTEAHVKNKSLKPTEAHVMDKDMKPTKAPVKDKDLRPTEAPVRDNAKKEQKNSSEDIFIHSVLCENFDIAILVWRTLEHPTHFALYAIEIINQMKSLIDPEHQDHINMLNKNIMEFEQLAINTVNNTYNKHRDQINNLLTYENENLRNTNCVMLAMKNNCGKFLSQPPCQELNQTLWRCGKLPPKEVENENPLIPGQDVRKILSPSMLASFRFFGHIVFLVLFAMWLVSVLDVSTFNWIEWLILSWIIPYLCELINQLLRNPMRRRRTCWSIFDYIEVAAIVLFILTWILRAVSFAYQEYPLMMVWTRVFFSVDYIMFCLLTLEFCCTSRFLGPKLIIIIAMSKVLVQFLLIILAFFTAFTVASQAVLYPNSEMNLFLTFHILKRPFWSVFGDFSLSDIDVDVSECTTDPEVYNKYTQLRCPTESGSYYVPALMGAYVIIVDILLFNLLIALFNDEIKRDENKSDEIWHHQTIAFTFEHSKLIFLPPPFIVLCPILWYLQGGGSNSPFIPGEITPDEKMELARIEAEQRDKVNLQNDIKYGTVIEHANNDELSATVGKMYQDVLWIKENLPKQVSQSDTIIPIKPETTQSSTQTTYRMKNQEHQVSLEKTPTPSSTTSGSYTTSLSEPDTPLPVPDTPSQPTTTQTPSPEPDKVVYFGTPRSKDTMLIDLNPEILRKHENSFIIHKVSERADKIIKNKNNGNGKQKARIHYLLRTDYKTGKILGWTVASQKLREKQAKTAHLKNQSSQIPMDIINKKIAALGLPTNEI